MCKRRDHFVNSSAVRGAVNTVVNNEGVLKGYNTDMDGFLEPIKKRNIPIQNKKILLIGAGGAARAIVAGMAKEKAKSLDIVNRTIENANNLSEFATKIGLTTSTKKIEHVNENIENFDFFLTFFGFF